MKTRTYHQDCIRYNEEFARLADRLARTLKDPEVIGWMEGIGKQHRYHAKKHKQALSRLRRLRKGRKDKAPVIAPGPSTVDEKALLSLADEITQALGETDPTGIENINTPVTLEVTQKENVA